MSKRDVFKVKMVKGAEMEVYPKEQVDELTKLAKSKYEEANVKVAKTILKKMQRAVGLKGQYAPDLILKEFLKLKVKEL